MTKLIAAVLVLVGSGCMMWITMDDLIKNRVLNLPLLGIAAFLLAGVLGIWQIADQFEDWLKHGKP